MKIFRNISDRKSALNCLIVAVLSIGIFFLHEIGPANSSFSRELTQIAVVFRESEADLSGIYEVSISGKPHKARNAAGFSILKALSKKLESLAAIAYQNNGQLPVLQINSTQHFQSRSLTSEYTFDSFS